MKQKKMHKKRIPALLLCLVLAVGLLSGCGASETADNGSAASAETETQASDAPAISGLVYESALELTYATGYDIYYYEGGYGLIDIHDQAQYLVVPEDGEVPEDLDEDIIVLQKPFENIYMAATATMALFCSMDAIDTITLSSLKQSAWTYEEPQQAMESGAMVYAGKYSAPDYELLVDGDCDLAVESTMIYHTPEVKEMIESLGIPVIVDRASYESNPLGRTEWVKLYGFLTDHEEEAEEFFEEQMETVASLEEFDNTEKTVAFFYFTSDGKVNVRASTDYIPAMIEMGGGRYVFSDLTSDDAVTISMTIEEFYNTAGDADYIVYNGSIDTTVDTLDELLAKNEILADFSAVQNDQCWTTGTSMYQRTDKTAEMILDFHRLVTDADESEMEFLQKLS